MWMASAFVNKLKVRGSAHLAVKRYVHEKIMQMTN